MFKCIKDLAAGLFRQRHSTQSQIQEELKKLQVLNKEIESRGKGVDAILKELNALTSQGRKALLDKVVH